MKTLRLSFALLARLVVSFASITNITIDDQTGDATTGLLPTYMPMAAGNIDGWLYGPTCQPCSLRPDPSRASGQSWHDASVWEPGRTPDTFPYVELSFTGTAIYIFCIVCDDPTMLDFGEVRVTNLSFALDGNLAGTYVHVPIGSGFLYNQPVYVGTSLSNTQHTVRMTLQGNFKPLTNSSNVLFDYAIYTSGDTTSDSPSLDPSSPPSETPQSQPSPTAPSQSTSTARPSGTQSGAAPGTQSSTIAASTQSTIPVSTPSTIPVSTPSTITTSTQSTVAASQSITTPTSRSSVAAASHSSATTLGVTSGGNHRLAVAPMAGGVAGGGVLLLAVVVGLLYTLKRRRRSALLKTAEPSSLSHPQATNGAQAVPSLPSRPYCNSWSSTKSAGRNGVSGSGPGTTITAMAESLEINAMRQTAETQQADRVFGQQRSADDGDPSEVGSLRARIEALQGDVERLRAEQVQWSPPPAYDPREGDSRRVQ